MLALLADAPPDRRAGGLSALRKTIVEASLSTTLSGEIGDCYRTLGAARVAVRSSATAEDLPGQSFAGQYDTYLGVADLSAYLLGVKRCWASLWTERAFDYRSRHGVSHPFLRRAPSLWQAPRLDSAGSGRTMQPSVMGR